MKNIILSFMLLSACTTMTKVPSISTGHTVYKQTYYKVDGAGGILRNTPQATIAIWIKAEAPAQSNEDIFNFSVGGKAEPWKTRAGFRVIKGGAFQSIARADDMEESSEINTPDGLEKVKQWQHVALTVDYTNKSMQFYIDGKLVETLRPRILFSRPQTADTNSHRVTMGSEDDGQNAFFNGDLAGAFVEARILSQDEIQNVLKKTRP